MRPQHKLLHRGWIAGYWPGSIRMSTRVLRNRRLALLSSEDWNFGADDHSLRIAIKWVIGMACDAFEEIVGTFEFLDDWEDRYRHVIDLGRAMPPMPEVLKVAATKVDGCASQVWIMPEVEGEGPSALFRFQGDSDAMIVRGLIAVLRALYCEIRLRDVVNIDAGAELARLGLHDHLSSQRSNGLRSMVDRIGQTASKEIAAQTHASKGFRSQKPSSMLLEMASRGVEQTC